MRRIRRRHRAQPGQSLVLLALVLPVLLALVLTALQVAQLVLQRAQVEDALRQATRSAAQTLRYQPLAANQVSLRDPAEVTTLGRALLAINLREVTGLRATPAAVADTARWWIVPPGGGSCLGQPLTQAALCAEVTVPLQGLLGRPWQTTVQVIEQLDRSAQP